MRSISFFWDGEMVDGGEITAVWIGTQPPTATFVSQGLFFRLLSHYSIMAAIFCFGIQLSVRKTH